VLHPFRRSLRDRTDRRNSAGAGASDSGPNTRQRRAAAVIQHRHNRTGRVVRTTVANASAAPPPRRGRWTGSGIRRAHRPQDLALPVGKSLQPAPTSRTHHVSTYAHQNNHRELVAFFYRQVACLTVAERGSRAAEG
jgi:hypothetical protein